MSLKISYLFQLLLVFLPGLLNSQPAVYELNVFKDNFSWIWLGNLHMENARLGKSEFYFDNKFSSNLFLETGRKNNWRDENNLHTYWTYRFQPYLSSTSHFKSQILSDDNTLFKFNKHYIYQEFSYQPLPEVNLSPAAGWAFEEIYGFTDQGLYVQMETDVNNYDIGGYENSTRGFSSLIYFPDRTIREHRYFVGFSKQFSEQASDSLQVGYELLDNSYPLLPGPEGLKQLEELGQNTRYLYNMLNYQITRRSIFMVETRLKNRDRTQSNFQQQNHRQELNFANRVGIRYLGRQFMASFAFTTSQETNLSSSRPIGANETRTDYDNLQSSLNFLMNWKMSPSDEAKLSLVYIKYEYLSPDTAQTVDRDRIRFITDLFYRHKFSHYFSVGLFSSVSLEHQIYIHPSRSINNNWNRIFQLGAGFDHEISERFRNNYRLEILANYTVYDFEEFLPEVRSYLFRRLVFTDTLQVGLTRGLKLQTVYQMEKEDNGTFFKEIYAQQISRELMSHLVDIGLIYLRIKGLELTTALNWSIRREWSFTEEKRLIRDAISLSPRLNLLYRASRNLQIFLSFIPRSYQDLNISRQYYTIGRFNLRYTF